MYYVYVWLNIKTNEAFYVGMGHGNRRFNIKRRNKLFQKYYEENECAVRLYDTSLNYEKALELEKQLIEELNPACNMTKGGERTDSEKISKKLKGRKLSEEHRRKLSNAARRQNKGKIINNKEVKVLDVNYKLVKRFEAKYQVGNWLHNEFGYGQNVRSAQRMADKYFKSKELFDDRFYFIQED
jgi:hypothetical protein